MAATTLAPLLDRLSVWNASETRIDEAAIHEVFKSVLEAGTGITVTPNGTTGKVAIAGTVTAPVAATDTTAGIVELATSAEATAGTDNTRALTPLTGKALVDALVDSAPGTLDTLNELAAALGDDPNFATTITTSIATKANSSVTITGGIGLSGGGDLTANRTVDLDINSLTAESTVDAAADYLLMYDTSAGAHVKVLPNNMPGLGEVNTASSLGGVSVFGQKNGVDLELKGAAAGAGMAVTSNATTFIVASTLGDGSRQLLTAA